MNSKASIIRRAGEGDKRWFFGGGVITWKLTAEDTESAVSVFEDTLEQGKVTPLHAHPASEEIVYVLEGELIVHANGAEHRLGPGSVVVNPRGAPHAFTVASGRARILSIVAPGTEAQRFYMSASAPGESGPVDFRKIAEAAQETGATVILGPPPFGKR